MFSQNDQQKGRRESPGETDASPLLPGPKELCALGLLGVFVVFNVLLGRYVLHPSPQLLHPTSLPKVAAEIGVT